MSLGETKEFLVNTESSLHQTQFSNQKSSHMTSPKMSITPTSAFNSPKVNSEDKGNGKDDIDLRKFLPVLPYGDDGAFGFVGWKFCTPDPDYSVGRVRLVEDLILKEPVVEVACAPNVKNKQVYIQFPDEEKYTGIGARLPFVTFQLKNIGLDTGVEIRCKNSKGKDFFLVASNNTTICKLQNGNSLLTMPMTLVPGWNKVEFDLAKYMGALGQTFVTAESVKVMSSSRVRRIFFSDHTYPDWELPYELRILPILEKQYHEIKARPPTPEPEDSD